MTFGEGPSLEAMYSTPGGRRRHLGRRDDAAGCQSEATSTTAQVMACRGILGKTQQALHERIKVGIRAQHHEFAIRI